VPRRSVQFVELGEGITFVAVVCEYLARLNEVADMLRAVAPAVAVTPLLDGPQLSSRWTARYASVLADDPASAVLTLTSYGLVERCRPAGRPPSSVVALRTDSTRPARDRPRSRLPRGAPERRRRPRQAEERGRSGAGGQTPRISASPASIRSAPARPRHRRATVAPPRPRRGSIPPSSRSSPRGGRRWPRPSGHPPPRWTPSSPTPCPGRSGGRCSGSRSPGRPSAAPSPT